MKEIFLEHDYYISAQFYDIDPMNVVWHGNYLKYMEEARSALMSLVAYDYEAMRDDNLVWPIVKVEIKYIKPVTLKQRVRIHTALVEYEHRLVVEYVFYNEAEILCKAKTTQFAVRIDTKETAVAGSAYLTKKMAQFKK